MTVKELIEALSKFPPDMQVCARDSEKGDYLIDTIDRYIISYWDEDNMEEIIKLNGTDEI